MEIENYELFVLIKTMSLEAVGKKIALFFHETEALHVYEWNAIKGFNCTLSFPFPLYFYLGILHNSVIGVVKIMSNYIISYLSNLTVFSY